MLTSFVSASIAVSTGALCDPHFFSDLTVQGKFTPYRWKCLWSICCIMSPFPGDIGIGFLDVAAWAIPTEAAVHLSAPACWQINVSSNDSPPTKANNTGHASPPDHLSSPITAANSSRTSFRSSSAAPAPLNNFQRKVVQREQMHLRNAQ